MQLSFCEIILLVFFNDHCFSNCSYFQIRTKAYRFLTKLFCCCLAIAQPCKPVNTNKFYRVKVKVQSLISNAPNSRGLFIIEVDY